MRFDSIESALDNFYFNLIDNLVVFNKNKVVLVQYFIVINGIDHYFTPQIIFHKYLTLQDFHKLMYSRIPSKYIDRISEIDTYKLEVKYLLIPSLSRP